MTNIQSIIIRWRAALFVRLHPIKPIDRITMLDMFRFPWRYDGIGDGLAELPCPEYITIGRKRYPVPQTMDEFSDVITYGQRMYLSHIGTGDKSIVVQYVSTFYATFITGVSWDEKKLDRIQKIVVHSHVIELYPVAFQFIKFMTALVERELKLLQREPSRHERMAGIDKLGKFAELTAIMFLTESFKCSESEVMAKPYNDCLVRFMLQKEQNAFAERLAEVFKRENESKTKTK